MKRCRILFLTALSLTMICSCGNDGYTYDMINGDLVLKTANGENFLKYNDEADYSIFLEDVFFSSQILSDDDFKSHFKSISDKVEAINSIDFANFYEEDIEDKNLSEIAAKKYFNIKDKVQYYEGESKYGHKRYYVENSSALFPVTYAFDFMRSKGNPDIPDGAVIVRIGSYLGEYEATSYDTGPDIVLAFYGGMRKMLEF